MNFTTRICGVACAVLCLGTAPARADVTAAEVWQGIVDYYAGMGQNLTAESKTEDGGTLVVTGAGFAAKGEAAKFMLHVPELRFRELGDGRVEITASDRMSATVAAPGGGAASAATRLDITKTGVTAIVSGAPGDMKFDFDAAEVMIATAGTEAAGQDLPVRFAVTLTDGTGTSRLSGSATRTVDTDAAFAAMRFDVTGAAGGETAQAVHATGTLNEVKLVTGMQVPEGAATTDMAAALEAGYRLESRLRFASANINADVTEAQGTSNVQAGLADGEMTVSLARDGMRYALGTGPSRAVVQIPALPVPAEAGLTESRIAFAMPVEPGGEAEPFAAVLRIGGLTLSEGIWAMFDPAASLPRDPMTAVLDVSGRMRLAAGLFDPEGSEPGKVPAEVEQVSLNEFRLSALGAEATGKGAATITNTGAQPIPVGTADFDIRGANALIDRLVAMGLVPQEQAMGLRMMMAMFTVPAGEDSATSRIEADAEGNVRVNGQVLYKFPKN